MPTLGTHLNEDEASQVEQAASASPEKKTSPYIAEAIRQRMAREGFKPETPSHDIRVAALAAAEVVGDAPVLAMLQSIKAVGYAGRAADAAKAQPEKIPA